MGRKQENRVYVESLRFLSEGHPMWQEELSDDLKPGAIGYVNGYGVWNTIAQLTDSKEDFKNVMGKDRPEGMSIRDINSTTWELKKSRNISGAAVQLDAKAIPPGAPAGADAGVQYTCATDKGALLLARDKVTCSRLTGEADAERWVADNLNAIIAKGSAQNIEKRGLWLVTQIYHTPVCAKRVFQSKKATASFHVGADVQQVATAKASASWWAEDSASGGWVIHRAPHERVVSTGLQNTKGKRKQAQHTAAAKTADGKDIGVVVFMGGIWWKPSGLFSREYHAVVEKERQKYLSGEDEEEAGDYYERADAKDDEEAYLKLCPAVVGNDVQVHGLSQTDSFWTMYSSDEGSEDEDEDE